MSADLLLSEFCHYCDADWATEDEYKELRFDNLPRSRSPDLKPPQYTARWFARGDEWLEWCKMDRYNDGKYKRKYRLVSIDSTLPVKVIRTLDEARAFRRENALESSSLDHDWYKIAQKYSAVYFPLLEDWVRAPTLYSCLDVASLVVFDRSVARVELIGENESGWRTGADKEALDCLRLECDVENTHSGTSHSKKKAADEEEEKE